jgi:hypothetical protein
LPFLAILRGEDFVEQDQGFVREPVVIRFLERRCQVLLHVGLGGRQAARA